MLISEACRKNGVGKAAATVKALIRKKKCYVILLYVMLGRVCRQKYQCRKLIYGALTPGVNSNIRALKVYAADHIQLTVFSRGGNVRRRIKNELVN